MDSICCFIPYRIIVEVLIIPKPVSWRLYLTNTVYPGPYPHWMFLTSRGEVRLHPMSIDGSIITFTPFHNVNCPQGFLYFNRLVYSSFPFLSFIHSLIHTPFHNVNCPQGFLYFKGWYIHLFIQSFGHTYVHQIFHSSIHS